MSGYPRQIPVVAQHWRAIVTQPDQAICQPERPKPGIEHVALVRSARHLRVKELDAFISTKHPAAITVQVAQNCRERPLQRCPYVLAPVACSLTESDERVDRIDILARIRIPLDTIPAERILSLQNVVDNRLDSSDGPSVIEQQQPKVIARLNARR